MKWSDTMGDMYRRPKRHFLTHTIEHLFGMATILAIAFLLGGVAKSQHISASGMLAQSSGSSGGTSATLGTVPVASFALERTAIACTEGVTRAKYRFTISPSGAGTISVMTPVGGDTMGVISGSSLDRYYESGVHSWVGTPILPYTGATGGTFTIENVCTSSTNESATSSLGAGSANSSADTTTTPSVATESATSLTPVSFSAQPGPAATCGATGSPLTPVFLVVTKALGGEFLVSSNTGMNNAHFTWGEYFFPNGTYTWSAVVKSGFVGDGSLAGTFEIQHGCPEEVASVPASSTNQRVATSSAATTQPAVGGASPPLPRPQLHLFLNNIPTTEGKIFNKEQVEVRITTAIADRVEIFATEGILQSNMIARAVKDDLLSEPGIDIWSYVLDMGDFTEGTTKLHVRVKHTDGRETLSERMTVSVKHPVVAQKSTPISAPPVVLSSGSIETSVRVSTREKEAVLARVSDPASCSNAEECKIYCHSLPGVNDLCVAFAQEQFTPILPQGESLIDGISSSTLMEIIASGGKYAKQLPEYITDTNALTLYCALDANTSLCVEMLLDNDLGTKDDLLEKREHIIRANEEGRVVFLERTGARVYIDTDLDGVTDYDEINIYHTDPQNTDTDTDGFTDGAELLARTNPSGGVRILTGFGATSSLAVLDTTDESVAFYNPMISGPTEPSLLVVKNIEVLETGTTTGGGLTVKKMKLAGTAGANAFVTLYIFSDPIVVTVKADGAGSWSYTLDKELPDGTHTVYSAITDAGGRILAKSEPLPFVKVAAAVSLGSATLPPEAAPPGFFTGASLYAMLAILIGILGVALSIIGFIVKQKNFADSENLPGL